MKCSTCFAVTIAAVAVLLATARLAVNARMSPVPEVDMAGKVVVITGGSAGIGKETARMLCSWGARVIIGARTIPKAERAAAYMKERSELEGRPCSAEVWKLDLASFASVRSFATRFQESGLSLDVLVANAGIAGLHTKRVTEDGHEMHFQTNHLSHFLLVNLLLPTLKASAPSRVVVVSSDLHNSGVMDFENLDSKVEYQPHQIYQDTKLYNVLFSNELQRRLEGSGVFSVSLHPGFVISELGRDASPWFYKPFSLIRWLIARSQEEGALTSVYAATTDDADVTAGGVYLDSARVHDIAAAAKSAADAKRLWSISAEMVGLAEGAVAEASEVAQGME